MTADASAIEAALRVTSDSFLTRVERLHALEEQKRELPPDEMVDMAKEVEALASEILEWAARQTELATKAAQEDDGHGRPIAIIPPRAVHVVLAEWRAAERVIEALGPGTAGYESARADVERLRDEYARSFHAQTRGPRS